MVSKGIFPFDLYPFNHFPCVSPRHCRQNGGERQQQWCATQPDYLLRPPVATRAATRNASRESDFGKFESRSESNHQSTPDLVGGAEVADDYSDQSGD